MDYGKPSPFELWRRENLSNMAVSKEILELIAKAFEGGQLSEREACAKVCEDLIGTRAMARHCADAIRSRGETK
jgi:hypothetical protein